MEGSRRNFLEVDHYQTAKHGQLVSGDVFLFHKIKEEDRLVAVLSDGLGSGVKAGVLATLTATMALKYTCSSIDILKSAEIIMDTLPICSVRKISYSTFTIVDMDSLGRLRVIEHGNPPYLIVRDGRVLEVEKKLLRLEKWQDRLIYFSESRIQLGDRIVFFSDGIAQAGMGKRSTPLGWGQERVSRYVAEILQEEPDLSARALARKLVAAAEEIDDGRVKDDTTCGVVYFRRPRRLLVVSGPPFARARDAELARMLQDFRGAKVISGGTTANIVARELGRKIRMDIRSCTANLPPTAAMDGVDLITEGTLTLGRVAQLLEEGKTDDPPSADGAGQLLSLLLDSDIVCFVVGTRINEAHQDPNIPLELDLRRNIVRRILAQLEQKHCKETHLRFL